MPSTLRRFSVPPLLPPDSRSRSLPYCPTARLSSVQFSSAQHCCCMSRRRVRHMYSIPCRLQSHRYITYIHRCIWISQISSHPSIHSSPPKQTPPTRSSCTLFPGRSKNPTRLHHGSSSSSFSTLCGAHSGVHSGAPNPWCSSRSTLASFPVHAMVPVLLFYSPGPQLPTAGRQACVSVLTPSPDGSLGVLERRKTP